MVKARYAIEDCGKWATRLSLTGPVAWTNNPLLRYQFDSPEEAEAFRAALCGGRGHVVPIQWPTTSTLPAQETGRKTPINAESAGANEVSL